MTEKLFDELKSIISDVKSFLQELSSSNLSRKEIQRKNVLLESISQLTRKHPQLSQIVDNSPELSDGEVYDDVVGQGSNGGLLKKNDSPDASVENASFGSNKNVNDVFSLPSTSASIKGYLVQKSAGKDKLGFVSMIKSLVAKKYCVVKNGIFFIFENNQSKKCSSSFPLKGYDVRVQNGKTNKKEHVFELVYPGHKSYYFAASSKEELEQWVNVLQVESLKNPGGMSNDDDDDAAQDLEDYEDAGEIDLSKTQLQRTEKSSLSPEDGDELYDDILNQVQPVQPSQNVASKFSNPPISNRKSEEIEEEIYDDIADSSTVQSPILPKQSTSVPQPVKSSAPPPAKPVPKSPVTSAIQAINMSKPVIVNSKDGLPYDKMFYSKWDCKGNAIDELTFKRGDILTLLSQEFDSFGWWVAELKGLIGLVPRDYLTPAYELISELF